jgi:undecaprenyl diphosphate synthase
VDADLLQMIDDLHKQTAENPRMILNLAIDYGGKDEVLRALSKIAPGTPVNDETLHAHLDHPELPDMDVIIRTSGEQRTSNFALWQSTYAEWEFVEKLFPDFSQEDLAKVIDDFEHRQRRFGA